jgi:hypothetical protein
LGPTAALNYFLDKYRDTPKPNSNHNPDRTMHAGWVGALGGPTVRIFTAPVFLAICQALKTALIGATIIVLAEGSSMAATITVHAPDGEGRVFVDVVGKINDGDFETFKEKTDPIAASHPKRQVIVTLVSYGGLIGPAMQIGERVRHRGMSTFVPSERTCASACALIWVAGFPRIVGDTPQIGFHAAYDQDTGREVGSGNAVMGAYLRGLGFGYQAIHFMTHKGPTNLEWLTPDAAKEVGAAWSKLQPPRAIPVPPQQPGLRPPLQVIAAWSKLMPRPVTVSNPPQEVLAPPAETVKLRFPVDWSKPWTTKSGAADAGLFLLSPRPTYPFMEVVNSRD